MNEKNTQKHEANRRRHNFLIDAFFKEVSGYGVNKSVPGWVLEKHINGDTGDYEVAIYTEESFNKREKYFFDNSLFSAQGDKPEQIPMR